MKNWQIFLTLFASLVAFLMIASLLAGCSSPSTPATTAPAQTAVAATSPAKPVVSSAVAVSTPPTSIAVSTTQPPTSSKPAASTPAAIASATTGAPKPANPTLLLASTTSTRDSGILDMLIPMFQEQTGYQVKPSYVGSGAAMALGQQGNADVLFVHSPSDEVSFIQNGYGIDRRLIMHNYFVIVGPPSDPAKIAGMTLAVDALKKIAAAKANFYSRGDNSGTDVTEKSLWAKAGVTVKDGSPNNPSWYIEGGAGTGMLALLQIADEKKGYTFSDMATYLFNKSKLALNIQVQGDPALINVYHVISVNPAKWPQANILGARAFADFMTSPAIQDFIATYGYAKYGQSLFIPDFGKTEAMLGTQ